MTPRGRTVLRALTRREKQILPLVCAGHSNKQVADRVQLAEQVIKNYLRCVFRKVGVRNRHELVVFCWQSGVVACPCEARRQFLERRQIWWR
jgi:DNA-binding NarL/FixJ family response regulator